MAKDIVLQRLEQAYTDTRSALHFQTPFELLVATILSAQCTDKRVNSITKTLFAQYRDASMLAAADFDTLAAEIHSCGCYNVKAKNLIAAAKMLVAEHGGTVPRTMEALTSLPGVGRKTANVVLSNAFNIPGLAVDTHVFRVSHRLGLADAKDPAGTERQLCAIIPREKWGQAHHWLIYHGRRVCHARKPECKTCFLRDMCPFFIEKEN